MIDASVHKMYVFGTGTLLFCNALITLYSRSMACADRNIFPKGFLRKTNCNWLHSNKYVGFD